jgi:hypothetical protein
MFRVIGLGEYSLFGKRFEYCTYFHKVSVARGMRMANHFNKEQMRWQVAKSMLNEFPTLRKKSESSSRKLVNQL